MCGLSCYVVLIVTSYLRKTSTPATKSDVRSV